MRSLKIRNACEYFQAHASRFWAMVEADGTHKSNETVALGGALAPVPQTKNSDTY